MYCEVWKCLLCSFKIILCSAEDPGILEKALDTSQGCLSCNSQDLESCFLFPLSSANALFFLPGFCIFSSVSGIVFCYFVPFSSTLDEKAKVKQGSLNIANGLSK